MKYSSSAQEKVFSDTFSTTALAVYEEFDSADELAYMDLDEITNFIKKREKIPFLILMKLLNSFRQLPEVPTVCPRQ